MMSMSKEKRAVPFIIKNQQTNCYQLTKQAQDILKKIDKNVSVVSVAGLYRTGKSYLLNKVILDKKSIFGVGPTVNPCTKGLWMWLQPDPTTQKRTMLVIDTEGLGALDEQANHDMKIFSLAVLLSTTFIYNSVGSIDETALQNLSLVLNLVNNIDQQNNSNRPQFIWVVRDFTLQLIDQKGRTLTPREYLQMALTCNTKQQQKSSIRKTITSAFVQRDCYTLVKPLIDENKLQNLDNISMDELRPQFVSQSIQLRNKIKTTLKEFKLTSSQNNITGKQYVIVVQKYLAAINSGAVPNMIDTWTFIKQEKCREALEEIKRTYTQKIKTKIMTKIPMKKHVLEDQFKVLKSEIKALFLKMTYDQSSTQCVDQFISNAYGQIMKLNAQQNRQYAKTVLNKQFEPFLKKLYSQYYNTFEQFEAQMTKNYRESIIEKYSQKIDDIKELVDRFADQKMIQNVKFFEKKLKQQIKTIKVVKEELEMSLNKQLSQINSIKQKERRTHQQKIFQLEKKVRLYENQREQLIQFGKAEKDLVQSNMNILKKKNQELNSAIQDLNREISHLHTFQNQLKEKSFMELKQNQKQRALFSQKQQYLNTRIRQLEQKYGEMQSMINQTGGRFQQQRKGMIKQYQDKIQYLQQQNKKLSEKIMQGEIKFSKILEEAKQMSQQIQNMKQSSVSEKKKLQKKILEAESNKKPSKLEQQLKQENQQMMQQLQKTNDKLQEATKKLKMAQQQLKNLQNSNQKQIAIHVQQIQFQQIQIKDLKKQYEQLKISHQNSLQNLHGSSKNQQSNMQLKIYELTTEHQKQIKSIEVEYEQKIKSFKKQIQMLQRHKQQMTLQLSLDKKGYQSKEKQWRESNNMLQMMVKKLEQKIQSSQKDYEDISKQKQVFYSMRVKQLQQQLEEVKQKTSQEISENSKKSQEAFSVLKHYAQIQKQQWEKRLLDEKERGQKKLKSLRDELEKKMNEERVNFEQEISDLQNRLVHMERVFNEKLQNMQYDHQIAIQKITNQYMQEKVQLNKQLALTQQKLQMTKTTFQKQLSNKIKYYESTLQNTKASLRQQFEQNMRRVTEQKENIQQKYDSIKKSNRQLEQANLLLKSQSDKERAVHKEKQKSFERKIIQLENRLQSQLATYNKTIENINQRHSIEIQKLNEQIDKLNYNVSSLQEQRDKLQTQHENNINRLQAKLKVVEESKNKNRQDYEDIVQKFQCAVTHFGNQKKKFIQQKQRGLEQANEKANQSLRQIEDSHRKMIKQSQDRIARLATQNKSLKQRLMLMQIDRSNQQPKKQIIDDEKMDKKYEKRIQQYKELYERQKQKVKKLKQQNGKFRMQMQSSNFVHGNSTVTYYERPSFSQISNSRLYNNPANIATTEVKRKYTNTPSGTAQRDEYSGIMRFNGGTGYKNRD